MLGASPLVLGMVAVMAGAAPSYAQAVNLGGGNNIIADGRTQTQVTVNGNQTSITTNTVANGTGFNSFSDFQQAANTRVDMYVPDGAGNLVNIVRNGPVVIDGVLNAYKDGQIGGNIFFASSQGFIVGAHGTVNVGSLSVTTPTSDFIDNVIRADGSINDTLAGNLLRGVVPLSPNGVISIAGTINAKGGVSLQGHEVNLDGGTIRIDGRVATHREILDSAVNTTGVVEGTALAMRGGVISIVASGNSRIAGVLDAGAKAPGGGDGGTIEVRAGGNITVEGNARLTADGSGVDGGGGTVEVIAGDTLLVSDHSRFTARGTGMGAGGFVELSGKTAIIGSAAVDLSAEHGRSGTLLFDPDDLYIGTLPSGSSGSVTPNLVTNGTNVVLDATKSITVVANGVIDTRSATGASGDITITAPLITIADGAALRANGSGGAAGNITLTATRTTSGESRIVIGTGTGAAPIINGHDVSLLASANVNSGLLLLALPVAKATIAIGNSSIASSGAFRAEATASAAGNLSVLPIGVVVSDVLASVDVGGSATISAASAALKATATASSIIGTTSLAPSDSSADGAVAVSTITSKALVNVGGNARITTSGALDIAARNTVVSEASAVPQAARFGASVAVSVVKAETSAIVAGSANISSGSLSIDAQTSALIKVTAQAAAGGASEPSGGSKASEYLDDSKYGEEASTSDGKVSVVGGLAISDLSATTLAKYASSVAATVIGNTAITAGSTTGAELVADGSAVNSATGVGVAVGINLARVSTSALAAGALGSGSLTLGATAAGNVFSTTATSGAGAENVGVAGSLATNIIDTESRAALEPSATIALGGALSLNASNASSSTAIAKPTETGVTGGKVGVGVSAALNVVANRATAEIGNAVALTGAAATTIGATGTFAVDSQAKAGASGGISVTPALALNMVSNATTSRIGTGGLLTLGALDLHATQQASNKAAVAASAAGSKAAVGAGLAIAMVNDTVTANLARSLTTTGSVSLVGMGVSLSELTVEASASGAKAADDAGAAPAGSKPDVDSQVDSKLTTAKAKQDKAGVGSADQRATTNAGVADGGGRSASTSEGKVSVAAAVGVNVQSAKVAAQVEDGVSVIAGGALTIRAIGNADGKVTATGSAVSADGVPASQVGIGAAVAVNKVATATTARLGKASHSATSVTIEALKTDIAALLANPASTATRADTYLASATSGAGGSKVGIAGSLGLNLIDTESAARLAADAVVTLSGSGAVALTADNQSSATAKALPVETGASGGKVGVGVSAAINIIANRSVAELENGAVLTGAGALSLSAKGTFAAEAEGKAGASGGISITPALGLNLVGNTTSARIGTGGTLAAGSVTVSAVQQATTTTKAAAAATGATAAVGASLALALVNDTVSATTARGLTTTGNVSFTAQNKSVGVLSAEASAAGAKPADDSGQAPAGDKDVDGKVNDQLTGAKGKQTSANVGSTAQQGETSTSVANGNARSAKTSEGKVSVAAAAAVNVTTSSAIAEVPDAVAIHAGGSLSITSANTASGTITADGSAVGASGSGQSQVGIGVAVAVNVIDKTNTARLGVATHSANGVTVAATQFGAANAPDIDTISATAASGAGGSKVGIAGSLALNIATVRTNALIAGGAAVNAGTGASTILADTRVAVTASAQPIKAGATGGKVGIGASVALNTVTTTTSATLADGASFSNGAGLAVSANSAVSTTTKSAAGSAGGVAIDAVVALALLSDTTTARIGTSATGMNTAGAVSISATSGGDHLAQADGNTKSGSVGIGAAAAVILGAGAQGTVLSNTSMTSATLSRDVTAASLAITAGSTRTYSADATATAKGGQFNETDPKKNQTTGGTAASADSLDKTKSSQQGTSGGGKVTVAAAVGIAAAQDVVSATLQGVAVNTTGAVTVGATNSVGMATGGSGLAVNSQSQVGVGIGVALGIINNSTSATIADGSHVIQSGSVAVTASTSENTVPAFIDKATAVAIAGASSSKVSVAGALAVAISTSSATAAIGDNVVLASAGAVNVAVDNTSKLSARSLAGSYTSGNVGVGASVASIVSQHALNASVGAGTSVTSASLSVTTNNRKVNQPPAAFAFTTFDDLKDKLLTGELLGATNYYAEAMGGAAASGSVAVQGSFAVLVFNDTANASIGKSLSATGSTAQTTITASGTVTLKSESDLASKAFAGGIAASKNVGVGVSSSVIVSSGTNRALFAAGSSVTAASVTALAKAGQDIQAFGITAAGGGDVGVAGVATAVTSSNTVETLVDLRAHIATSGATLLDAQNDFKALSVAGGAAAGGKAGIGGAASVVTINNVTRAALAKATTSADAVTVEAGGAMRLSAKASETGSTFTAAGAAANNVAVAAGAALYVVQTKTEAYAGDKSRIGQTTQPSSLTIAAEDKTSLDSLAGAAAGASTVGAGAGASVGVILKTTIAAIAADAHVRARDISIAAKSSEIANSLVAGVGIGGTAGLAGALGVYTVVNTTTAEIGANAVVSASNNVAVLADDTVSISFLAGALAASSTAAVGASAAVAVITTDTTARIASGASVTALGLGDAVEYVTGYTPSLSAFTGSSLKIGGKSISGQTITAAPDTEVTTADQALNQGLRLLVLERNTTPVTATARGLVVNATGQTAVRSMVVGAAGSGQVAVAVSGNVPVIIANVTATIQDGAKINLDNTGADARQSVAIAAAQDVYRIGVAGSVGIGTVGVGGGVETSVIKLKTSATIGTADVKAQRDVIVAARASQDFVGTTAAAAVAAGAAVAGGFTVLALDSTTEASLAGTAKADGNIVVSADDVTRSASVAGSLAIDVAGAGVGGSVNLAILTKRTSATIAANADVTALGNGGTVLVGDGSDFSATRSARGVIVTANSNESLFTFGVAGAGGFYAGVAGAVSLQMLDIATTATVGTNARVNTDNTGADAAQDVVVLARNSSSIAAIDGGLAVSLGAGVSGAADIGILRNTTAARISDGATVGSKGQVDVLALQNVATSSTVLSAAGALAGIAAGISVYSIGDGIAVNSEGDKQINSGGNLLGYVQGQLANNTTANVLASSDNADVRGAGVSITSAKSGVNLALTPTSLAGTSASIGNAAVTSGGAVTIGSRDKVNTNTIAGGLAAGVVSLGAGVGIVTVSSTNTAQLVGTSTVSGGSVKVDATSAHTMGVKALAGSVGYTLAAQAAVAFVTDTSHTKATIAGTKVLSPGAIVVNAGATRTGSALTAGASLSGSIAVGVSYGAVNLGGAVEAGLGSGTTIGASNNRAGSLAVTASSANTATTSSTAVAGGIGVALLGAVAEANATTKVTTGASNATIYTSGQARFAAQSNGKVDAQTFGLAISGSIAAGGSVAKANLGEAVETTIADGSTIDAGSIELAASVAPILTGTNVSAQATGSAGGLLVGLSATDAQAINSASANVLASGSVLRSTGLVRVASLTNTAQYAQAKGLALGIVALGANSSLSRSTSVSQAILRDMVSVSGGDVRIVAEGQDRTEANTTSGSGGIVAGAAATARTIANNTTRALADTSAAATQYTIAATGQLELRADHTSTFAGKVDSTQAAVVGASGATIAHTASSTVEAKLGDRSIVRSASLAIRALSAAKNFFAGEAAFSLRPGAATPAVFDADAAAWNVDSGSGGLLNLPAGSSTVTVTHATTASIGDNADVLVVPTGSNLGALQIEAHNETIVHQKAKLDSGGAIALADSDVRASVTANATAAIGAGTKAIVSLGDIAMAAWGSTHIDLRSAATTYGLAGAPSGTAAATYTGTNTLSIGAGATLMAAKGTLPTTVGAIPTSGTVSLSAGTGLLGEAARLSVRTTVDLFNKTAIPISTTPDARSTVVVNSNLLVADSQNPANATTLKGVLAAGDITLRAGRGSIDASAVGTGKDIYREALAAAASAISNAFGGGDVTFDYHGGTVSTTGMGTATINGLVATGIERYQTLVLNYQSNCTIATQACTVASGNIGYTLGGPDAVGTDILKRLAELKDLQAKYKDDPIAVGAYANEVRFLQNKLVALGLGSYNAQGAFVPGTYAGPSPRDAALQSVAQNQADIGTINKSLAAAAQTVVVADSQDWGMVFQQSFTDTTNGIDVRGRSALASIGGFANHATLMGSGTGSSATYKALYDSVGGLITDAVAAAKSVGTSTASNVERQTYIQQQTAEIQLAQAAQQQALIDGRLGDAAAAGTRIQAAKNYILDALNTIATNNTAIATQSATAKTKGVAILAALNSLRDQAAGTNQAAIVDGTASAPGALAWVNRGINGFTSATEGSAGVIALQASLNTAATTSNTAVTRMSADASSTDSVRSYVTKITTLTSTLATNTATAATAATTSGTPTAYTINIANTLARLGNISVVADRLVGSATGSLSAPGDAKIEITNNTANTLRVGNLLIPTYDAGRVRLNGVLVTSNSDINALQGGAYAGFASVTTATGSSRPLVSITSNYNPDSLLSYNPASGDTSISTARIAPDIILNNGATIDNLNGAVKITSAAGNIYLNGTVNAGSVEVLAKNGDFVSSYVNGFNHIGGDPASFNSATRAGEAGQGITANGAISIAARYININSTIQSGIANWTLNLNGSPTLTTATPSSIGLTQAQIDTAIQGYKTAMAAAASNPANVPSSTITLTNSKNQTITLNMAPAGMSGAEVTALNAAIKTYLTNNTASNLANPVATLNVGGVSKSINLKDFLSAEITGRLEFSMADATAFTTNAGGDGLFGVISPTSNIGVSYDTRNTRYLVDGTSVRGGYIQLYGQIMNTASGGGNLNVLDGFGTINITNTSTIPVVLQTLNAGTDASGAGRGTAGIIDITDIVGVNTANAANPVINVKRTVYSRDYDPANPSGNIRVLTQNGSLDNQTGDLVVANQSTTFTGTDRSTSYATTANQRYVWSTGQYYDNTTNFTVKKDQLFGADALTIKTTTSFSSVDGPHTLDTYRLPNGTYVTVDRTQTGSFSAAQTNQGVLLGNTAGSVANGDINGTPLQVATNAYMNSQDGPTKTGESRDCNWWTLCIASKVTLSYTVNQKYTVITTNSLKADNPIGINFIGSNTGAINVTSASDVVLTGNITASNGTVAITSQGTGSIVQGDLAAQIAARNVTLTAAGSAGGITYSVNPAAPIKAAVAIDLRSGVLNASAADGNVVIGTRGSLKVGQVTAAGNVHNGKGMVNLVAANAISAATSASLIQGPRVSLTATNGAIGSTTSGAQLHVNSGYSTAAGDRVFGDPATDPQLNTNPYLGLSASAAGDIGITATAWSGNVDGTMLVDKVVSTGGNIRLTSTGHILDNNPAESIDQRTYAQLLGYWNALGLVDNTVGNDAKQAANVAAFERATEQSYQQYWRIRASQSNGGTSYDPTFSYHVATGTAQYAALSQQFGAEVRDANPGFTDAQVASGVAQRIADYETAQTSLYRDLNGKVGALTTAYNVAFDYHASQTQVDALSAGSSWTKGELAFSLSPGALKAVTATNPVVKDANVSGRSVTIEAQAGIGETVRNSIGSVGVTIAGGMDPSLLTMDQRVALASAERSDLQLTVLYQGASVVIPLGADYAALTTTQQAALNAAAAKQIAASNMTITVLSKRPLNFNATEALNVSVTAAPGTLDTGVAHLASRADAPLGNISVLGETRIKTMGSIFNTAISNISTGNLILEAAQGSIGSSTKAVNLTTGTATFTGRAQGGVYVDFNGNGVIDTVYSPGNVSLKASGALTNANNDSLINVLGKQIKLAATTTIGTVTRALNVGNSIGGGITASAGGLINLFGPATNLFSITSATSAAAGVTLTAAGNGTIDGLVQGASDATLTSGTGRFLLSSTAAVRAIAGDVSVTGKSLVMRDGATLTADAGRVLINLTGDAQLTGISAGSSAAQAVDIRTTGRVYAGNSSARAFDIAALNGGVSILALAIADKTLTAADTVLDTANPLRILSGVLALNATGGSIHVGALAAATQLEATVAGNLAVTAAGTLTLKPVTTAGYQNYLAQGDIAFAQLTAAGPLGNITLASVNGALTGTNITASGSTDLTGNGIAFDTILSGVDSRLVSSRDIVGTAQIAGNAISDSAGTASYPGSIRIGTIRAKALNFDATGTLILPNLEVGQSISLSGGVLQVGLTQVPSGPNPLTVNLTGGHGSVGTSATVTINAPAGVIIPTLRFIDADITTTANNVKILDAYMPGQLRLTAPLQTIVADNRTPAPQHGNNIQLYQPLFGFSLGLQDYHTSTTAFIVKYDASAQATVLVNGLAFDGISLVRDSVRAMFNGDPVEQMLFAIFGPKDDDKHDVAFDALQNVVVIDGVSYPIARVGNGPAVQLSSAD